MTSETVLAPRRLITTMAAALTVVGLVLTPSVWSAGGEHRVATTLAVGLVFLALPLWAWWFVAPRRIVVLPDRVEVHRGARTPEVRRRPELLVRDAYRELFARLLDEASGDGDDSAQRG